MRIGITQRVEVVPSYGERRDCLDQQWYLFLEALGFTPVPIPNQLNDVKQWVVDLDIDGLVLSGGNDISFLHEANNVALERDITEVDLLSWAYETRAPVIGICRGQQMMHVWLGGSLIPVVEHTAVRHTIFPTSRSIEIFRKFSEVNSFHNWGISQSGMSDDLIPQCLSIDGEVEAFCHKSLPWVGIMWHPEREVPFSENDKQLFKILFETNLGL